MYPQTKNIVLGAGYIYFDEFDANGNPQGELYLAESENFSFTVNTETVEVWSDDGPIAEKLVDVSTRVTRDGTMSCKNINGDTLSIFLIAAKASQTTTTGSVTAQAINDGNGVLQGRWYQLGASASQPAGVRNISAVSIKDSVPTTYTVDTDYKIDLDTGRIYIVPGGGIADDTVITADYTKASATWEEVTSNDLGAKSGALRFVSANTTGDNRDVFMPSVVLKPDGEFSWKSRETVQQMNFAISVQKPSDGRASVYINGRAA